MSNLIVTSLEQRERVRRAESFCSTAYANWVQFITKSDLKSDIISLLAGKDILDIGCGEDGGLVKIAEEARAKSFTGVDINNLAVELSTRKYPQHTFICDEPIHVINGAKRDYTIVSSGLWDLIKSEEYRYFLAYAISKYTKKGEVTIHTSQGFVDKVQPIFIDLGFNPIKNDKFGKISIMQKCS